MLEDRRTITDNNSEVTVVKTARQKLLEVTIKMLWEVHGVKVQGIDIYICGAEAHLCTSKTADLFHTSYHNFSNAYVPQLLNAGVHRIVCGRHKYYNINETLAVLTASRNRGVSVFEICDKRYEHIKKLKKRRNKNG